MSLNFLRGKNYFLHLASLFIFFLFIILCPIALFSADKIDNITPSKEKEIIKQDTEKKSGEEIVAKGLPTREYKDEDFMPKVEEESYAWMIFKTILILGFLVGGFYFFFRFVTKRVGIQVLGENVINILSIVPIGQNKYLQVVDLAGKILVLGVSENGINLISEINEKDKIDQIRLLSTKNSHSKNKAGFQDYIMKHIGKLIDRKGKSRSGGRDIFKAKSNESGVNLDYLKRQKDRLKNLNGIDNE